MTKGNDLAHPISIIDPERQFAPEFHTGLTKREYFAAMAMQGLWQSNPDQNYDKYHVIAYMAVKQADALINALNETK